MQGDIEVLYSQWHGRQRCQLVLDKDQMRQFVEFVEAKEDYESCKGEEED